MFMQECTTVFGFGRKDLSSNISLDAASRFYSMHFNIFASFVMVWEQTNSFDRNTKQHNATLCSSKNHEFADYNKGKTLHPYILTPKYLNPT